MSIDFAGFCGPSYQLENKYAAIEKLSNWYTVANESTGESKFKLALDPFPGNAPFCRLPLAPEFAHPNRGLLELRGKVYGVNGPTVFSLDASGVMTNVGTVLADSKPVSMVANGTGQIFIASSSHGYVIPAGGGAGSLIPIPTFDQFLGAAYATFQDGYILVVTPDSNQFQISGTDDTPVGDATLWSAGNVSIQAGQADFLKAILSSREYVRLFGSRRSQVYQNVGNSGIGGFPFQSYNETFIETGLAATFSLADMGDSLIWMGEDARGQRACWRDSAFQPRRISTFAVERFWQQYSYIGDAVAFPFIWMGHLMYQITFPSAFIHPGHGGKVGATWVYDATVSDLTGKSIWCERQFTDAYNVQQCRSEQFHCFAFGKHLVGSTGIDGLPGAIYQYDANQFWDMGVDVKGHLSQRPIVRDRICPHLWAGNKRVIYNRIEFELARGVGLSGAASLTWDESTFPWDSATFTWDDATGANLVGVDPQVLVRWSNDGGNTFGRELNISAGLMGQYGQRCYLNRLGYGRDRVFWTRCTDPVYWAFTGAELDLIACGS